MLAICKTSKIRLYLFKGSSLSLKYDVKFVFKGRLLMTPRASMGAGTHYWNPYYESKCQWQHILTLVGPSIGHPVTFLLVYKKVP